MNYGYVRCSTNEKRQDIDRQIRELKRRGIDKRYIYCEYESGTKINRIELNRLLDVVEKGDSITCTELSRITRSTKQLCDIIDVAKEKHLKLILGDFIVDCTKDKMDAMTEGMLKMMGVFAELERNMISERVKSGLENARDKGKVIGRPSIRKEDIPEKFLRNYKLYKDNNLRKVALSRICNLSRPTVNKYIKLIEKG